MGCNAQHIGAALDAALEFLERTVLHFGPKRRGNADVVRNGPPKILLRHRQARVVGGRQLEDVIHLNRVERTNLGAEPTTHTGVIFDDKFGDGGYRLARHRIFRLGHVNNLRRTDARTLVTRCTQLVARLVIVEQNGHIAVRLGKLDRLFGVFLGEGAVDVAEVAVLAERLNPVLPDHDHAIHHRHARQTWALSTPRNLNHLSALDLNTHALPKGF